MPLHPQAAQGVLHHIVDDPIRGKELGGSRNIFLADFHILLQGGEDIVLFLTVVVLIEPADDLYLVLPVLLRDKGNHLLDNAALPQQIVRKKQLRIVSNFLEHPWQNSRQGIALDNQQVFVQFLSPAGFLQSVDLLHIQTLQLQMNSFIYNLGPKAIGLVSKDSHMGREIAVDLHKA